MTLGPRGRTRAALDSEETVRVESEAAGAEIGERLKCVADHKARSGESGVEPVDRGLTLLEVVQVDPAPLDAVDTDDRARGRPVGVLDAVGAKQHTLERPDDVTGVGESPFGDDIEVDRVAALGHLGEQAPVLGCDRHHVEGTGVFADAELGEPEVGALAGVRRNEVVDDGATVARGDRAKGAVFVVGAESGVDARGDAVEVAVDRLGVRPPVETAGLLDRAGVHGLHTDGRERPPEVVIGERRDERSVGGGDERGGVRREPHRRSAHGSAGIRQRVRALPHGTRARELPRGGRGRVQHRLTLEPRDVLGVGGRRRPRGRDGVGLGLRRARERAAGAVLGRGGGVDVSHGVSLTPASAVNSP